jgi:hypothetical protein
VTTYFFEGFPLLHLARRLNKDRIPGGTVYHR